MCLRYILLIEDAVRALGGKWSCFAMPYWDWTLDAGKEDEVRPSFSFHSCGTDSAGSFVY